MGARNQGRILRSRRLGGIHHNQREVGIRHGLIAALDPQGLHQFRSFADTGGVIKLHRDSADGRTFGDQIAGGPGDGRDDGPVLLQQHIEKATLADVGPAHDGEPDAVPHQAAELEARGECAYACQHRFQTAQDFVARGYADIVFGEVDAGFEESDQFQQVFFEGRDAA